MSKVTYFPNQYTEGVNIFVSVNKTMNEGVPVTGRSKKQCIAKSWYFFKEEEARIVEAIEAGLPVTITGIERGVQRGTYMVEGYEIIDIADSNPEVGITRRFEFILGKPVYQGGPIFNGSLGMHAVAVKGLEKETQK